MGICYYGVCLDCKRYVNLDKFYAWRAYQDADHCNVEMSDLSEFKEDGWIVRALRLHIFISAHNGHHIGVYSEYDSVHEDEEMAEQFPWPDGLKHLVENITMNPLVHRLVIKTPLGEIFIDATNKDVNCFRFVDGVRMDTVLLTKPGRDDK